jgi:uncharacterized membrane protein
MKLLIFGMLLTFVLGLISMLTNGEKHPATKFFVILCVTFTATFVIIDKFFL